MKTGCAKYVGRLSFNLAKALDSVQLVRHESAKDVFMIGMKPMLDDVGDDEGVFEGPDGSHCTIEDMIESIEEMGYWGYFDSHKNTIHLWFQDGLDRYQLVALLGHELEHAVWEKFRRSKSKGIDLEEKRADLTGAIAVKVVQMIDGLCP